MTTYVPVFSPRLRWALAPARVADWVERELSEPVLAARDVVGGFSSGVAAVLRTASGRRAFVKAVHAELNPHTPDRHRHEIAVNAVLPESAPVPRLRAWLDEDGWVGLLFDAVDGAAPDWPWRSDQLEATLAATRELRRLLTPCRAGAGIPTAAELLAGDLGACARLAARPGDRLDPWTARHLERLVELAASLDASGTTLLNLDVRADNVVVDRCGAAWVVDWSWGCVGAAFQEALPLLVNAAVTGHDPQPLLGRSSAADAAAGQIDAFLAMLIGMWAEAVQGPEPPGVAGLREFQRTHLTAAQEWLDRRWG